MLNRQGIIELFHLEPESGADTVLIFAEERNSRLDYTCNFIFRHVLGVNYSVSTGESTGAQVHYSGTQGRSGITIVPSGLLSEKEIIDQSPEGFIKSGELYFFESEWGYHFDIFSAVFFFISRYEEWMKYTKDAHGRFEAGASLHFKYQYQLIPLVDRWILEFSNSISALFPEIRFRTKRFSKISTLDIDNLYAFRSKGLMRTLGAIAKDLVNKNFSQLSLRLKVLSGKEKDPFDIYEEIASFCFERKVPLFCFFLLRSGTAYDRTIPFRVNTFKKVIETLKRYFAVCGLHPSYYSMEEMSLLKKEVERLAAAISQPVRLSRQHYLRFDITTTPKLLADQGIEVDFSMGFATQPGFRAGTAFPFYYYDFANEAAAELLFVPFCFMEGAFSVYDKKTGIQEVQKVAEQLESEVRKSGGVFATVFHERSFYDHLYKGYGTLYKNIYSGPVF